MAGCSINDLFDRDEKNGENTGYFAIIVQNMKTYEHHEMIRYAVKLPCKITGKCDTDSDSYIIRLEHE